jgi:hypothetical protein
MMSSEQAIDKEAYEKEEQRKTFCEIMRKKKYADDSFYRRYYKAKGNLSQKEIKEYEIMDQWWKLGMIVCEHPDRKEVEDLMNRLTSSILVIAWENERTDDA